MDLIVAPEYDSLSCKAADLVAIADATKPVCNMALRAETPTRPCRELIVRTRSWPQPTPGSVAFGRHAQRR
jgi:hypothetical protein